MEGHAKKCVERYCEFANITTQQFFKVATPCLDDHQCKEEENESVGELTTVCSHIFLKCLHLACIGRLDFLWSVNKLARAVTKWTKSYDKRLARLISYINHTCEYGQYCYVGNTAQQMQIRIVSRFWFCRRPWRLKIDISWTLMHFRKQTFVPISWMCKKQTAVSHSSKEVEIISLDAGIRMDGIPALDLWGSISFLP